MLTKITFNLANAPIRHETLQGKKYLVAPMAMITEGVHNGSGGPLLYKEAEIKRAAPAWNMKPIVVYHPELDGQGISACDPVVLEKQQVGVVMNARWAGNKLRAEAWIEESLAEKVDNRVIEALEKNKIMEVSTGLFTENTGGPGKWNDKDYVNEATNHQPDHLALLPDQIGACSVADGAGLLQINEAAVAANVDVTRLLAREMDSIRRLVGNAMSNSNVAQAISGALRGRFKPTTNPKDPYMCGPYLVDVYPNFCIYEMDSGTPGTMKLFKLTYDAAKDGTVTLGEETPTEVVRVTEYRTADTGKFVGNEARTIKENHMDRKNVIDGLIANEATGFVEADRAVLEKTDDTHLALLAKAAAPKKSKTPAADPDDDEDEGDTGEYPAVKNGAAIKGGAAADDEDTDEQREPKGLKGKGKKKAVENARPRTAKEYVEAAPAEIRDMLTNGLAVHDAEKAKCIETITANKANKFGKEFLATKGLAELQGMAALCANVEAPAASAPPMFFGGAATSGGPVANAVTEAPLVMPTMNFEKAKK